MRQNELVKQMIEEENLTEEEVAKALQLSIQEVHLMYSNAKDILYEN